MTRFDDFKDPIGLVRRMLASNDPAAHSALLRSSLRVASLPADLILLPFERHLIRREVDPEGSPILLVVGGSRTGTTLVTQVLARHLEVSPTTNLVEVFPRSPMAASRLFGVLHGDNGQPHGYRSYYGNTAGLRAPNDAFDIWNRWLGSDRYRAVDPISEEAAAEMRRFFAAWANAAGRPVLNKNNRNTGVMGMLAEALPTARFVVVRRDPLYSAQSLLIARKAVQGDRRVEWGFAAAAGGSDPIEAVAKQVVEVARTIRREEGKVDENRLFRVEYERFCADPTSIVGAIGERLGIPHDFAGLAPFRAVKDRRLPATELEHLAEAIERRGLV